MKLRSFGRRRIVALAVAGMLVTSGFVWAAQPSPAASPCPIPGGFEIDGDMLQNTCTPAGDDWNTSGLGVQVSTQGGTYSTAGKDGGNPSTWVTAGSTPNKADFARAYAFARVVGGHYFAYVAWERTSTSGTQGYAIEIDNSGTNVATDGTPQPNRSKGGYVFYISAQGSSAPTFAGDCVFTSQSDYGSTCSNSAAGFDGAVNTAAITDPLNGNASVAIGGFDEIGLDVTTLTGIAPSCPGASAASLYLRSITGQTSNGNLKGYMAPFTLQPNSTCVVPPMSTTATPGNSTIDGLTGVAPGTAEHDVAMVGTNAAPGVGTVQFVLCPPSVVTANGGDCSANGTNVGTPVTLSGTGQATSDPVSGATDTATGKYCWRAEFTPGPTDHNYLPGTHTNSTTECFTVLHASPTIATQIQVTGDGSLGLTSYGDTATLSSFIGDLSGQTVNFSLFGPYGTGVTPTCATGTGEPVFTTTGTLNSSGVATTASSYTPTSAGTYVWEASYGGDTINSGASEGCNGTNESGTIVGPVITVTKSANPPGPVNAGDTIGFDIMLANSPAATATNVVIHDTLPLGGGDLSWSLVPPFTGCSIAPVSGHQVLTCTLGNVAKGATIGPIHVQSSTTSADCATISNTATFTSDNGGTGQSTASVLVNCASLSLTKTAVPAGPVNAGDSIGFTVTLTNNGAGTAYGTTITDDLPGGSGIHWTKASGPANCTISGPDGSQVLTCTSFDLGAGVSETVHVTSGTDFASCATYTNTASATATNADPPKDATASVTVQCPSITFTKTADPKGPVSAGDPIGFTVTVANGGPGVATAVVISDPLPTNAGLHWTIGTQTASACGISGPDGSQVLACTIPTLASGASYSVTVTSTTTAASCATITNTALLTVGNDPSAPPSAQASVVVDCPALTFTKTADPNPVSAGSQIGFTVTVSNSSAPGTGTAKAVVISDPLPLGTGLDWSLASGSANCSVTGTAPALQTLTCTAVDLAPGGSVTAHVVSATVFASCATYTNTATLTSSNAPTQTKSASTTVQCPSVTVTKTADPNPVSAGDTIGFTIVVANGGPGTATGVTMSDTLPTGPGIAWTIDPAEQGTGCGISSGVLTCAIGDLASGDSMTVHITSPTAFASCNVYSNTATATVTNEPSILPSTATTEVDCPAPAILKQANADTVSAGQPIGFTITASNADVEGTGIARGVTINDPLPGGSGVNWTLDSTQPEPANCSITGSAPTQTLVCTAVDLGPGDSESVHITSTTVFASCGLYDNTATLSLTNGPITPSVADVAGTPEVFTSEATTTVDCPALSITKTADADAVNSGSAIGFTIAAKNTGAGVAFGAVIQDPLPAHPGVHWTVSPAYTGPGTCAIAGPDGGQVLTCELGDLAAGGSATVHITSATTAQSCGAYDNTASLVAGNAPGGSASATTTVNCAAVLPLPPPVLAKTGAGPINVQFVWAGGMVALGLLLLLLGRRRRTEIE